MFLPLTLQAQTTGTVITGKVISAKEGTPLPGVVVRVEGSTAASGTDVNGNYNISVPDANATLVFTYIGYETLQVPAAGRTSINIQLKEDVNQLKEVVIQVPYGTQTKASFTGSAEAVGGEELESRPRASFQESLQGNVAGLQVSQGSGQPGAAVNINIRGLGSYSASNQPLFVVDGVPMTDVAATGYAWSSNTLAGINPNDIETVTVLKDASATSIYGSRGANGVILITTKRGSAGNTKIDFNVQQGVNTMTMFDKQKPLSTTEMTDLLVEGVFNRPDIVSSRNITSREDAIAFLRTQSSTYNPEVSTDWADYILRDGSFSQYNLSASGGTDKTTFFVSGGYYNQEAVVKGVDYERLNSRLNLTHRANDRLNINASLGANYQDMNTMYAQWWGQNPIRNLRLTVPWVSPYNADGTYNTGILYNNEILVNENKKNSKIYQLLGNLGAEFKIIEPLSVESKVGIDFNFGDEELYWDPLWSDAAAINGIAGNYATMVTNWNITNLLKFRKQFGDFGVEATLGQEAQKAVRKRVAAEASNFVDPSIEVLDGASVRNYVGSDLYETSLLSFFLNTSFNYKGKYYLNLTGRRDGSSRFGPNVQYGNFGSVGVAWNVEQEEFMRSFEFINALKLRSSFGTSGNQPGNWYAWMGFYGLGHNYFDQPGYGLGALENRNLSWEKNKPFDVGAEFSLFNYRISGSFDYYTRTTSDLLFGVPVSFTNGGPANVTKNIGSFRNSGIELTLKSQNLKPSEGGLSWETSFNFSTQKNEILKMSQERILSGFFVFEEGGEMYEYWMKGWAGVNPENGEGLWWTDETMTATTTDYNAALPFNQGSSLPDFFGGLTNTFGFKGLSLSFQFYYSFGNKIYDNYGHFTASDGAIGVSNIYGAMDRITYENRWQKPGDVTNTPKVVYGNSQTGVVNQHSSRFLYDGSYIRLRDITLAYELPLKRFVNRAQVYVRGNNLWTYVKDDLLPYDPEGYLGGLNNGQVPVSKQVTVGLNLSF
ncbi:SusC/RagA family TonB-linked outer membrane protein [Rufibacter roseus]|uniref:SusC/RagA family TonB-linked outer membrane protein n=1 Tax=Rufibacter roseus TaxID=1567108 RepID=UPI00367156E1